MANITVTIPDAAATRVQDAVCGTYGWTAESGVTKAQFVRDHLRQHLKSVTIAYEAQPVGDAARAAKVAEVDSAIG